MKLRFISLSILILSSLFKWQAQANEPDSAYLFAYGENGLRYAWSVDEQNWNSIGNEYVYLSSDFGRWGSQKKMYDPVLIQDKSGKWHCMWTLNDDVGIIAHTTSDNLTYWTPQSYPYLFEGQGNCRMLEVGHNSSKDNYVITWVNTKGDNSIFGTTTKDFKHFDSATKLPEAVRINQRDEIRLNGRPQTGTVHKVSWKVIDHLIGTMQQNEFKRMQNSELMADDPVRFANLETVEAQIAIDPSKSKSISDMLIGIFYEDINYAADGGMYAELIQNRGFEYSPGDRGGDKSWNSYKAWNLRGDNAKFAIETSSPVHINNKHYAVLEVEKPGAALQNEGFDGIAIKKGDKYDFSFFARNDDTKSKRITIRLSDKNGNTIGETNVTVKSNKWKKYSTVITANKTEDKAVLELIPQTAGKVSLDMISLFPQKTFKNRKNGLRNDLAQTLADMKPRFVRFPGGCVAHGDGLGNMYRWKNTIGALEERVPQRNMWGYHQSAGLGYFEYFQFCEDIGAEPLPVVPAGVPCQNSGTGGHGQQCGIPMHEMQEYIQEILDLIEWANGDPKTNKWAKMRADAGHPKPFNLKYLGIGNEDLISDVFEERYAMICNAIKEKYPEIIIIGTAGPFFEGSDYVEGWRIATELELPMIDEHYYNPPGWYIHNQDFYDRYDRNKPQVYLGEYAAHVPGRHNNIESALAEALHLINVERNGDIVALTSYAPLLAKEGFTQWNPDLIYFNNTEVKPTVGYHVQKLYGHNSGDEYVPNNISISVHRDDVQKRIACSIVNDSATGSQIIKLVNLLPVEVKAALDTDNLQSTGKDVIKTVLSGQPNDKAAKPVESTIEFDKLKDITLPPYSFMVLKIQQ